MTRRAPDDAVLAARTAVRDYLVHLRLDAGMPSYRAIADKTSMSQTKVYEIFTRPVARPPAKWDQLCEVIQALEGKPETIKTEYLTASRSPESAPKKAKHDPVADALLELALAVRALTQELATRRTPPRTVLRRKTLSATVEVGRRRSTR